MKPSVDGSSFTSKNHAPEAAFLDALNAAGLDYSGPIIADSALHRFKVKGDRNPNGWYVLHSDGLPAGSYGCWKRGFTETWCAKSGDVLTEAERADRDRLWAKQREERDADRQRQHREAAGKAQAILDAAQPAPDDHPYLVRKAVKAYPGVLLGAWPQRQRENCLLIPLRTADGRLATVQAIFPDKPAEGRRDKDFLKGGTTKGAYFTLGDLYSADTVIIAEGYATAATLHDATGHPAVMALDAGNLKPVAEILKKLHPKTRFIIAADNDRFTEGNPGIAKATLAAKAIKAALAVPEFAKGEAGSDFNDLAEIRGLEAVKAALDQAGTPARHERSVATPSKGKDDEKGKDDDMPDWFATMPDEPPDVRTFDRYHTSLMRKSGSSELLKNHYNAVVIVENAYPGLVGYNEFRQRIEARIPSPWRKEPGQWTDADTGELAFHLAKEFASFTLDALSAAVMTVAYRHKFNPAQERLRALADQWDGSRRLENWLVEYLGAAVNNSNSAYLTEIGAAWMKGVAARVLLPGCKRDDVLVTRGAQGIGKSTAALAIAEAIAPDAFTDSLGNLESKDSKAAIRGIIIAELGELSVLNKSDLESVKVYVATRTDHFREAYGRGERDYPRTVSFIGTTNHPTFLKDPTGNRRFWPVTLPAPINIPRFKAILPQLLGEAARRVLDGEQWFVNDRTALAQAEAVRAAHFQDDVWTDAVLDAARRLMNVPGSEFVTIPKILTLMEVRIEQQTVQNQMRIGGILRVAGWNDKKKRIGARSDNRTVWAWFPPVVPPESRFPLAVPPSTPSQTAAVPPVPPGSPYLGSFNKNEETGNHSSEGNRICESEPSADHFYPLYESRGKPGEPGEPLGKQRLPVVPPPGSPTQEGEPPDEFISHPSPKQPTASLVDADPIAVRAAELEAEGWAPWNAKARAEDEAREARP